MMVCTAFDFVDAIAEHSAGLALAPDGNLDAGVEQDLILWLYGRVDLDTSPVTPDLLERFRALCFTD